MAAPDIEPKTSFVERHQSALLELLELPFDRLPSFTTLRRIMIRISFVSLTAAFNAWAAETFEVSSGEQLATDGKSIKASVRDYDKSYQDFISVVSAFSVNQGVVVGLRSMHNHDTSEIATVQSLLEVLNVRGACFTFDALHTQKKLSSKSSIAEMLLSLLIAFERIGMLRIAFIGSRMLFSKKMMLLCVVVMPRSTLAFYELLR